MHRLSTLFFALLLMGCASAGTSSDPVQIRVANESDVRFDQVIVNFPDQEENYGAIEAGGVSTYRQVGEAYRYAHIQVRIGQRDLVMQPMDFVGESLLTSGRYTYVLDVDDPVSGNLELTLRREDM
jgi:hypothetical protein